MRLVLALLGMAAAPGGEPLRVRATDAIAPCARAAAVSYQRSAGTPVAVEEGPARDAGAADVLVAVSDEMTRALEGGLAESGTDVDVARVPWVLSRSFQAHLPPSVEEVQATGQEVWIFGGPLGRDARRALAPLAADRVHETTDVARLRSAPLAVVPLSLAGNRDVGRLEVPPLLVQAAVLSRAGRPDAARAFVRFLSSDAGQKAFASCAAPPP
jgi:hypothetical protein